jgi:hypothetical protein
MLSILKQQESGIKEVIATINENIDQQRDDPRFWLPELREDLVDLLQEHSIDTQDLTSRLGEGHPVSILCEQRENQLIDAANETIYLSDIILRAEEEWYRYRLSYDDEAEPSKTANAEAAAEVQAIVTPQVQVTASKQDTRQQVQPMSPPCEADHIQSSAETVTKDTLQVTDSNLETIDTAVCLPLETTCEAAVATRQQAQSMQSMSPLCEAEGIQSSAETVTKDTLQAEQAMRKDTLQVKDMMHQTLDTAHSLPIGPASAAQSTPNTRLTFPAAKSVSEQDTMLHVMEGDPVAEEDLSLLAVQAVINDNLQVKELSDTTIDTAVSLPLGPASAAQPTTEIRPPLPPSLLLQHEDRGELGHGNDQQSEEEKVRGCIKAENHQVTHLVQDELHDTQLDTGADHEECHVPIQPIVTGR